MKQKFRDLLERNRWIKWIPNALTLCNSLCGFAAILITLQAYRYTRLFDIAGVLAISAGMILFAMVFDALDGFAARILNAASMHGLQMDSLSDMVTFGVAPATVVAVMAHNMRELARGQFLVVCFFSAVYLGCAALRLATYNVHAILEKKSGEKFSGLPSPGAAAAICSLVIYCAYRAGEIKTIISFLPIYAAILGLLMVSKVPYTHFGKWIVSTKRNKKRLLVLVGLLLLVSWRPIEAFVVIVNAYVVWGPISYCAVKLGFLKNTEEMIREQERMKKEWK